MLQVLPASGIMTRKLQMNNTRAHSLNRETSETIHARQKKKAPRKQPRVCSNICCHHTSDKPGACEHWSCSPSRTDAMFSIASERISICKYSQLLLSMIILKLSCHLVQFNIQFNIRDESEEEISSSQLDELEHALYNPSLWTCMCPCASTLKCVPKQTVTVRSFQSWL